MTLFSGLTTIVTDTNDPKAGTASERNADDAIVSKRR